jgi:hypothetical protein
MHGGKTPRGISNPNTKTGRYSADLPTRLLGRYEDLMTDDTLLSLRNDIALLSAAIGDELSEIKKAEAEPDLDALIGATENIANNWMMWDRTRIDRELADLIEVAKGRHNRADAMASIRSLISDKADLIAQENKLMADRDTMIPIDQIMLILRATAGVIRREVRDPQILRNIESELARILVAADEPRPLR